MLDEIYRLDQLDSFNPEEFLDRVAHETASLPGDTIAAHGAQLDALRARFVEIDRFASRLMGIRLTQDAQMVPVPVQLRTLVTATVVSYDGKLDVLRDRVYAALLRSDPATAQATTTHVMDAAERVLATRSVLYGGVLELAQKLADTRMETVSRSAKNRALSEAERRRWGQARVDLEQLGAEPLGFLAASFADRIGKIAPPPDEPEPESQINRATLLEVD